MHRMQGLSVPQAEVDKMEMRAYIGPMNKLGITKANPK